MNKSSINNGSAKKVIIEEIMSLQVIKGRIFRKYGRSMCAAKNEDSTYTDAIE